MKMKWMKVLAVALAAVVVVFPALAQVSTAQAVPIPEGDVLADDDLAAIEGLILRRRCFEAGGYPLWWRPPTLTDGGVDIRHVCEKIKQAAIKVGEFTMRVVTFTAVQATQHPLARDTVVGTLLGMGGAALTAEIKNEPLTLKDVALGGLIGGTSGALGYGIGRGFEMLARKGK